MIRNVRPLKSNQLVRYELEGPRDRDRRFVRVGHSQWVGQTETYGLVRVPVPDWPEHPPVPPLMLKVPVMFLADPSLATPTKLIAEPSLALKFRSMRTPATPLEEIVAEVKHGVPENATEPVNW